MTNLRLLVALAATVAAGCHGTPQADLPGQVGSTVIGVRAVKPAQADTVLGKVAGEIKARREAALAPETGGRIYAIRVDVGGRVRKGDVLVELDSAGASIQVRQARAALGVAVANSKGAVRELERTTTLAKGGAVPGAALERATTTAEQASASLKQAEAAVASAEEHLRRSVLRAPFDGVVTGRFKSVGEMIPMAASAPVVTLVDLESIEVKAAVPETLIGQVGPGAELKCTVSPSNKPFRAKVRVVGSVVDPATRTIEVRADPLDPRMPELRPGSLVQVDLAAKGTAQGLFLRSESVHGEGANAFVWVVAGDKVQRRPVRVETAGPGSARVIAGLTAEDLVVVDRDVRLTDGAAVRVAQ